MLGLRKKLVVEPSRRKAAAAATALIVAFGLIATGLLQGSGRSPASTSPGSTPRAQLGQAPSSEAFNQAYQMQLEGLVREQMQSFRAELDSRDRAREARDTAELQRMARLVNDWSLRISSPAAGAAAGGAVAPPQKPRYVVIGERLHPSAGSWRAGNDMGPGLGDVRLPNGLSDEAQGMAPRRENDPFVVPQDGWAEGRLINGVVTTQGGEFRYAQIKLQGMYHSANDYEQNIDGCVVLGESTADIPAGRINIKPIKLTCTLPTARTKTWQTAGYVVDSRDGIQGVAATLVSNGGNKLLAATGAGVVQGGGAFYAQRSVTSTFSPATGSAASVLTGNPANALVGGAVEGAGRNLGQEVQDYYGAFRPTVQAGGGVRVVVFITTSLPLPEGGQAISTVRGAR